MKQTTEFTKFLIFLLLLIILFWVMPNEKTEIIGDFFEKIIKPLSIPLSIISTSLICKNKLQKYYLKEKNKSP